VGESGGLGNVDIINRRLKSERKGRREKEWEETFF
jgi:hypothetical protein